MFLLSLACRCTQKRLHELKGVKEANSCCSSCLSPPQGKYTEAEQQLQESFEWCLLLKLRGSLHFWKMPRKWVGKGSVFWEAVVQRGPGLALLPECLSDPTDRHRLMWKETDVGSLDPCVHPWVRFAAQQWLGMASVALLCVRLIEVGYPGFIF